MRARSLLVLLPLLFAPLAARAQETLASAAGVPAGDDTASGWRGSVGGALIVGPRVVGRNDLRAFPLPWFVVRNGRFFLAGTHMGATLFGGSTVRVSAVVRPRLGWKRDDSEADLVGLETRRWTVEGGLSAGVRAGQWGVSAAWMNDLLGRHHGHETTVSLGRTIPVGGRGGPGAFTLHPAVGVQYQSASLVDYYYGVRPNEVTPTRPAYTAGSATNLLAGLGARVRVTPRVSLFGMVRWTHLARSIADSPLVDNRDSYFVTSGVGWAFGN